eukprot:scaffold2273_cov135-Cylindrotheca_fusiformis.AAC.1
MPHGLQQPAPRCRESNFLFLHLAYNVDDSWTVKGEGPQPAHLISCYTDAKHSIIGLYESVGLGLPVSRSHLRA